MAYQAHTTTKYTNYFDHADIRVRYNKYCLDAQLLNVCAQSLEDFSLRFNRELNANILPYCPGNIDNFGVYYACQLANNFPLAAGSTKLNTVQGVQGTNPPVTLTVFDDRLPVPAGYKLDPDRTIVAFDSPIVTSFIGGSSTVAYNDLHTSNNFYPIQYYGDEYTLAIPNNLTFVTSLSTQEVYAINVEIKGTKYPNQPWANSNNVDVEFITITQDGVTEGIDCWQTITSITVRGLPVNNHLDVYCMQFKLPVVPDTARPYYDPRERYAIYSRYWQVDTENNILRELYSTDNLTGLEINKVYSRASGITDIACEPNTWGAVTVSGTSIIYIDRREPIPDTLLETGIYAEPLYGLNVYYDTFLDDGKSFIIRPVAYNGASTCIAYRLSINSNLIYDAIAGGFVSDAPNLPLVGWNTGQPTIIGISPAEFSTDYLVTLQCKDIKGNVTTDVFPYVINSFSGPGLALSTSSLAGIGNYAIGVSYDIFDNLWIWDGNVAIPLKPYYNGYILDTDNATLYLTDKWDSVNYE
jgi:hypothetical protein